MSGKMPVIVLLISLMLPFPLLAEERQVPKSFKQKSVYVTFNEEMLTTSYVYIDARTSGEKAEDARNGCLKGAVIVYFQGHGQRAYDGWKFTSQLALRSRSGVLVVPISDTPYGKDEAWRGDKGKMVVLVAVIRHALGENGFAVDGYKPLTDMPVQMNKKDIAENPAAMKVRLASTGWSHGGVLSRMFASSYSPAVTSLGHVCPAGYGPWKDSPCHLSWRFFVEVMHIMTTPFYTGDFCDPMAAGWNITKGVAADASRSVPDSISSCQPSKLGRSCRDVKECAIILDDSNAPLPDIRNISVIFGERDTVMSVHDSAGIKDGKNPKPEEIDAFWKKFYPQEQARGVGLAFSILPGTHIGPLTDNVAYAKIMLKGMGEYLPQREENERQR